MSEYPPELRKPFYRQHAIDLQRTYQNLIGKPLLSVDSEPPYTSIVELYNAPFALLSHGIEEDPIFNFGNQQALDIFGYSWEVFTALPSRLSTEPLAREERQQLLDEVTANGYIDNYSGIRIAANGRRFKIIDAVVWNIMNDDGDYIGQAAKIDHIESVE